MCDCISSFQIRIQKLRRRRRGELEEGRLGTWFREGGGNRSDEKKFFSFLYFCFF